MDMTMTKREQAKRKAEAVILANAHRLYFVPQRGGGYVAEMTREVAAELWAALTDVAQMRQWVNVVQSDADYVVISCRIEVVMDEWKAEVEDIGEAWAREFEARQKAAKGAGGSQKPEAAGQTEAAPSTEAAPKAEAATKTDEAMRYRMYRTATTRALKRAMELLVGDLNSLLKGLAILYGYKQTNNKGGLKALPPEAAPIIRALGAAEIGVTDAIKGLAAVIGKPQTEKSHEG
jgi:hypothetical protein